MLYKNISAIESSNMFIPKKYSIIYYMLDIKEIVANTFATKHKYIIFYRKECWYSSKAIETPDSETVNITNQKDKYIPILQTYAKLKGHDTYPIVFKKENNKISFIGGNNELQAELHPIQHGGGSSCSDCKGYREPIQNLIRYILLSTSTKK